MAPIEPPEDVEVGAYIRTPWSAHVIIKNILVILQVGSQTFYGVLAETMGVIALDWGSTRCLLWAFHDGLGPCMWQNTAQPSRFSSEDMAADLDHIVAHYAPVDGECYFAVKWKSSLVPTWEKEADLTSCATDVTKYILEHRI